MSQGRYSTAQVVSTSTSAQKALQILGDDGRFDLVILDEVNVAAAWKLIDSIVNGWENTNIPDLTLYRRGSWGPTEAMALLARDGRRWRLGCIGG